MGDWSAMSQSCEDLEQLYRERIDDVPDWIWEVDAEGRITFSNRVVVDMLGYSPDELFGKSIFELLTPEDRGKCRNLLERARADLQPVRNVLALLLTKSGAAMSLGMSCIPIIRDHVVAGFRGIGRDITEQHCLEAAVHDKLDRYRAVVDNSPSGIFIVQDSKVVFANPTIGQLMDLDDTSPVGMAIWPFVHPDDRERLQDYYRRRVAGEDVPTHYEARGISAKGKVRYLDFRATLITHKDAPAVLMNAVDMTEYRLAEHALRESEEKFRALVENTSDWVWEVNEHGIYTYSSPRAERMLGYTSEEVLGKTPFDLMPPEEAERVAPIFRSIARRREQLTLLENTMLHKNGQPVVVETSGVPIFDDQGTFRGYRGIDRDITERKRHEVAMRESEERYRALFERNPDMVFVIKDGIFTEISPSVTRLMGYVPSEVVGLTPLDISPDVQPDGTPSRDKAQAKLTAALDVGPQTFEWLHRRKDGSTLECEVSLVSYIQRRERYVQAIVRDISERKRAEERQRVLEKHLEAQKRHFYRETILSVTDGKLDIGETDQVRRYISRADVRLTVSEPADVGPARREVERYCREHGLLGDRLEMFMVGVGEVITNAIKHATKGRVYAGTGTEGVWVGVADRGPGISSLILPRATLLRGFSTKPSLGMGYSIVLEVSDHIILRTGSHGTVVILEKDFHQAGELVGGNLRDVWGNVVA